MICRKICDVLKARGHQVWFDETHIPHGSDWRAEIVNGIITSEGVLSMIDRHSVRDPGVCLDEMSIAIGVRGGNIRYVLLEKQAVAEPPASMTTRQWLDMSDWHEHEDDQAWFDTKMGSLIQMVESKENLEFAGIIDELRKKLTICHVSTSKQESLLRQPFIGREWVKDRVDAWLDDPDGTRICFVFGDPGIGKSAFAAHYTHYNGRVAAAIFCDYNNTHFNRPRSVIQTLAFLLACRLPDYRIALADALDYANDLGLYNESELFDLLLAQPLSVGTVDGNRETMCILIDGLDESGDRDRNILTEVLTKYAERLPKWLRIMAFSRKVEIITGLSGGADTIDLTGGLEENKADIRAYFEYCLSGRFGGGENYTAMIDSLSENSGGIFLYATLMSDALQKGKMSIEDTGSVPDGLDSAFYRWFQWFFPDIKEYEKDWQMPLACIAASPEPIPEEEIKIVFGWTNTKLNKLKHTLEVLFRKDVNDFKKDTLQLSHKYISEWLFSDAAGRYQLDREDAFREMGAAFFEIYKDDPKGLTAYEAYYLRCYVNLLPRKKSKELLLEGLLHGIVVAYGDYAKSWSRYETAMKYYTLSEELALDEDEEENGLDRLNRYGCSLSREGNILELLSQYSEAMALYLNNLDLSIKIASERGTLDDLRDFSISYKQVASIYKIQRRYEDALKLYYKSLELSETISKERGTLDDLRELSVGYSIVAEIYRKKNEDEGFLGDLAKQEKDYEEACELDQKALELSERIATERGDLDDLRRFSDMCSVVILNNEKITFSEKGFELAQKAMKLNEKIVAERGTLDDLCELYRSYALVGVLLEDSQDEKGLELCRKALELSEKVVAERGTLDDLWDFSYACCLSAEYYAYLDCYEKAFELYQKELELKEKVTAERETLHDLCSLSDRYKDIAEIYEEKNRYEEAFKLYRKELGLSEKIAAEQGTDKAWRRLSDKYLRVAKIYEKQSRYEEALELYLKVDYIYPSDWGWSYLYETIAGIYEKQCRYERALEFYLKSRDFKEKKSWYKEKNKYDLVLNLKVLELTEKIVSYRGNLEDLSNLSDICEHVARIYFEMQNRYAESLAMFQKALELRKEIVAERETLGDLEKLTDLYESVSEIYETQGRHEEAMQQHEKALEVSEKSSLLRIMDEKIISEQYKVFQLGIEANRYELLAKDCDQYEEALELCQKALELREKLDNPFALSDNYFTTAKIYEKYCRYEEALGMYLKEKHLREKIAEEEETLINLDYLSDSFSNVARIYEIQGRYEESLKMYQKCLEIKEKITTERGTMNDQRDLYSSLYMLAGVHEKQKQYEEALQICLKVIKHVDVITTREDLFSDWETLSPFYRLLYKLYRRVSDIYTAMGKREKASCYQIMADNVKGSECYASDLQGKKDMIRESDEDQPLMELQEIFNSNLFDKLFLDFDSNPH